MSDSCVDEAPSRLDNGDEAARAGLVPNSQTAFAAFESACRASRAELAGGGGVFGGVFAGDSGRDLSGVEECAAEPLVGGDVAGAVAGAAPGAVPLSFDGGNEGTSCASPNRDFAALGTVTFDSTSLCVRL